MNENEIKEKAELVCKAIGELSCGLTDEALFNRLAEINNPLAREAREQKEKAETLRASHAKLRPRVEAQVRILGAEMDRLLVEGNDAEVEEKRRASGELTANLQNILTQADEAESRAAQLQNEQTQNARTLFEETYPQIRESTAALVIAVVGLLERTWGGLERYGKENAPPGTLVQPLVGLRHWADLTPREAGPEAPWFLKMREWFAGRRA